ncbi:MAG: single-stranded DNA-binding protein [Spirochaetes bacterium]|nr:single-stranded DNA-binding protein [Spirochaetota bacterium]
MNNFNQAVLEGFLTADPETKMLDGKTPVCNFTIGSNRSYTRKDGERVEEAAFFDITTWNTLAENCGKFLKKGARVLVGGTLRRDVWKSKEGEPRSKVYVEGRNVEFLTPKKNLAEEAA